MPFRMAAASAGSSIDGLVRRFWYRICAHGPGGQADVHPQPSHIVQSEALCVADGGSPSAGQRRQTSSADGKRSQVGDHSIDETRREERPRQCWSALEQD
jgi:hypothetical protein